MPNWCENTLTVSGDMQELCYFKQKARLVGKDYNTQFSLNKFIPLPKKEKENWYDWHIANWGTKWDVTASIVHEDANSITYQFDSAWNAPAKGIEKMSRMYPRLKFVLEYQETGMGYMGEFEVEGGNVTRDRVRDIPTGICSECKEAVQIDRDGYCMMCGGTITDPREDEDR